MDSQIFELKAGAAQYFVNQNFYEQNCVAKQTSSSQRNYVMQNVMQGHSPKYGTWPKFEVFFEMLKLFKMTKFHT